MLELNNWKEEAERLRFDLNKPWAAIAGEMQSLFPGMDKQQILEKVRGYLRTHDRYKTKGKIVFENKKEPTTEDIDAFYETMKLQNAAIMKLETKQNKASIRLDVDKPILLNLWGDWHLGAKGVDYKQHDEDEELINETEGSYFIGMGDYKDNGNGFVIPQSPQENTISTDMQDKIVERKFQRTADKWLAVIRGCHDDWDKRNANKDFVQNLCDITNSINLWHGGIVNLSVGDAEYRIGVRHKYKNESGLNTTNTQRSFVNEFGQCDIVGVGHKHFCEVHHLSRMGEETVYMRSGTYKLYDEYGQKLAGYEGAYGVPSCILYPDKKLIIPFRDLKNAVKVFRGL